ncbi:hypothetical protein FRC03_001406 [Tulasnella sp. 419]|nr:hypothetical protein FRC03_001406 [Tulasnella sp. 419]
MVKEVLSACYFGFLRFLLDLLVTVKSHLADTSQPLIAQDHEDLLQIARLAESFSNEKYRKGAAPFMDVLDQEGVNLWNSSILMRPDADSDPHRKISFAFIRLAAFRLIEAGMPSDGSSIEALIRVLQLANKAAACLAACEQTELAASVLITGAQLEEELQKADDPSGQYAKPKSGAIVSYYSSRMEAAWKEDNESVAVYMLEQAINDQNLQHLDAQEVELIASKVLDIGTSILRSATIDHQNQDGTIAAQRALVAVNWIQKALWLSERVGDKDTLGVNQLKVAILKSLARAYYHSSSTEPDNLAKSEATLEELTAISIANKSGDAGELQQLRWMKLSILKRRAATEQELIQVFKDIIDHLVFTESNVTEILQEIRLQSSSLVTSSKRFAVMTKFCLQVQDHHYREPDST